MYSIINILTHPYIVALFSLFGVVGGIVTIISFVDTTSAKRVSYTIISHPIIRRSNNNISKLKIFYDNNQISDLTMSKVVIWNSGKHAIKNEDIPKNSPLQINISSNARVLNYEISGMVNKANGYVIEDDCQKFIIRFDYIGSKEGIIIDLLHTGTKRSIDVSANVIEGKQIRYAADASIPIDSRTRRIRKTLVIMGSFIVVMSLVVVVLIVSAHFDLFHMQELMYAGNQNESVSYMILISMLLLVMGGLYYYSLRLYFKIGIPPALRKMIENWNFESR